jgi:ABC-type transport system involved in multi-copper enzyme maturation permease subunit
MNWLIWKQHRKTFFILVVILALYAALAIPTGLHFWHEYQNGLATCGDVRGCAPLEELTQSAWFSNVSPSQPSGGFNIVILLLLALPYLLGMFVGVPLICREYNNGTNLLVWTRSVSRRKWLTTKLAWTIAAVIIFGGAIAALTTWWSQTGNALNENRFDTVKFGLQGITPVAYAVFAVSLGIALGTWLKRIMAAIGVMFIVLLTLQIVVGAAVRPHYIAPLSHAVSLQANEYRLSAPAPTNEANSWVLSGKVVSAAGQSLSWINPPQSCVVDRPSNDLGFATSSHTQAAGENGIASRSGGPSVDLKCLERIGYHWEITYQPASRYWYFQLIETGLYLALSLMALVATYWLVLKRDA